jgi:hypothetical protein
LVCLYLCLEQVAHLHRLLHLDHDLCLSLVTLLAFLYLLPVHPLLPRFPDDVQRL